MKESLKVFLVLFGWILFIISIIYPYKAMCNVLGIIPLVMFVFAWGMSMGDMIE